METIIHSRLEQVLLLKNYLEKERVILVAQLRPRDNPTIYNRLIEIERELSNLSLESVYCSTLSTEYDEW